MKRRSFLASLIAVPAAAYLAPTVLATSAPFYTGYAVGNLTYKDIPVTTGAYVTSNQIYFVRQQTTLHYDAHVVTKDFDMTH